MARPLSRQDDRVLLVEGSSDEHVIFHLCKSRDLDIEFITIDKRGAPNLINSIRNEINVAGRKAVGIVLDANDNLPEKWNAVKRSISDADITRPDNIPNQGMIIKNTPRVGVWFMPDNQSSGAIEDFVIDMIPERDPVWPLSMQYIDDVPRDFLQANRQKAILHSWLATKTKPGLMGAAISAGDFDTDGDLCDRFCNWLQRLFTRN